MWLVARFKYLQVLTIIIIAWRTTLKYDYVFCVKTASCPVHTYPVRLFWFLLAENRPPKRLNRCGSADDPFLRPSTKLSSNRNLAFFRNNWNQKTQYSRTALFYNDSKSLIINNEISNLDRLNTFQLAHIFFKLLIQG